MDGSMTKQLKPRIAKLLYVAADLVWECGNSINALAGRIDPDPIVLSPTLTPDIIAREALMQLVDNMVLSLQGTQDFLRPERDLAAALAGTVVVKRNG